MQVTNDTPLPVAVVPSSEDADEITSLVLVAATFRIGEDGLSLAEEQRPLRLTATDEYPHDAHFLKGCASVCATGFVYAPEEGARRATAKLVVGDVEQSVVAFGPRVWREGLIPGTLAPTEPLPFEAVAMTWDNAYGGSTFAATSVIEVDGEETIVPEHDDAFPLNIDGTGFYRTREQALLAPLPQLEHPEQLVGAWDDRPEPVCFAPYPLYGGMRAASMVRDKKVDLGKLGRLPSRGSPRTTFSSIPTGTAIRLFGMRPRGRALAFTVPPPPAFVEVSVGASATRLEPSLDAVDIDAEAATVRLVYRAAIRYGLVQYELRTARIGMTESLERALKG
jgi:hypothetical protein